MLEVILVVQLIGWTLPYGQGVKRSFTREYSSTWVEMYSMRCIRDDTLQFLFLVVVVSFDNLEH